MIKKITFITVLILALSQTSFGQFEETMMFIVNMLVSQSPELSGLGGTQVCIPDDNPGSVFYNPANGLSRKVGLSGTYSYNSTDWSKSQPMSIDFNHEIFSLNYNPENSPFQISFSRQIYSMDLGTYSFRDFTGDTTMVFNPHLNARGLSTALRYRDTLLKIPLDLSAGISVKSMNQYLNSDHNASSTYYDWGFLLSIPLRANIFKNKNDRLSFRFSPSVGYSLTNYSDTSGNITVEFMNQEITYILRKVKIGIAFTSRITFRNELNLIEWKGGRAANDVLVKSYYPIKFQSGLGDIDFLDNVIFTRHNSEIEMMRGNEITILEIYSLRRGSKIYLDGDFKFDELGYVWSTSGVFNILGYLVGKESIKKLSDYISFEYSYARLLNSFEKPLKFDDYRAYTISINHIDRLIKSLVLP